MPTGQCGRCGTSVDDTYRFCRRCGAPVAITLGPPDLSGQTIDGRFFVEHLVRRGPAFSVSRAQDAQRLGPVALVVLHPDTDGSAALGDARRAAEVRHPGVLPTVHTGRHGSLVYLVEPWCDGTPLAELLEDGPLAPARAIHLALDLLAALNALHATGMVHAAVGPRNVLVERDWSGRERARLAVVGVRHALALERLPANVPGIARADLRHVAPELFRGAEPTPATDVYQVGVLLSWMLSGERPFDGDGYGELAKAHMQTPPPELTDLDAPALAAAVQRCLEKRPEDRFASAAQASRALRRRPLPLPPEDASVGDLDALEAAGAAAEDWRACARALERKVAAVDDPMWQAATLFQLAELAETKLSDPEWAARAYEAVLDRQPDDFDAFDRLAQLYERAGRGDELRGLLLDRARWSHDPEEHVELHERAAGLCEEAGDPKTALIVLGRGFERSGDDERLGDDLLRLADATDQREGLAALYEEVAARLERDAAPLWRRLATWCEATPRGVGRAVLHLRRVLLETPDDVEALDRLEGLLERTGRWEELSGALRQHAQNVFDPNEHAAILLRLARALEAQPDAAEEAARVRREVLDLGVEDVENMDGLARQLARLGRWDALADLLERRVAFAHSAEERASLYLRVGNVSREQLDDPERALAAYLAVLDDEPGHRDALGPAEVLLAELGRDGELVEIYRRALPTRSEREQVALLARIAATQRAALSTMEAPRYGTDPRVAARTALAETCWELLRLDGRRADTLEHLHTVLSADEKWTELAVVYTQHIEALGDAPRALEALDALATVYRDHLDDPTAAIEALDRALVLAPERTETVAALVELYAETERWGRCVELLGREVHWPEDGQDRVERWCRIGRILLDEVEDPGAAARRFHEVLLYAPGHPAALAGLAELHERHAEWDRLANVLRAQAEHATEPSDYGDALVRLGELHANRLDDAAGALDYYEHAVEVDPKQDVAAERLAAAWWAEQRWPQARRMYALVLDARPDTPATVRLTIHLRIAECDEAAGDHDAAFEHFRAAFELDGTALPALLGMSRQLFRRQAWDRALSVYQTLVLHHREALDDATRAEVMFRQGMIKQTQGAAGRAEAFFEQTLSLEPGHREALAGLAALHEEQGDWARAVEVRQREIEVETDEAARADLLVGVGDILRAHLDDTKAAAEAYEAAQAAGGPRVVEKLLTLARQRRDWAEVARLSLALSDLEPHPRGKARRAFLAAEILRDRLRDIGAAADAFEKALDAEPGMLEAYRALDDLLTDDPERLEVALRSMLRRATDHGLDDDVVADLARRLGRLLTSTRPEEAIRAFRVALAKIPNDAPSHAEIAALYESQGDIERALQHTWRQLALQPRRLGPAHVLFRLLRASGAEDGAWCVSHALQFRGVADAEETAFYERHAQPNLVEASEPLPDGAWALIDPPEKSAVLDRLFLVATPYALPSLQSEKKLKPFKQSAKSSFTRALAYAARIFGVDPPVCVKAPDGHGLRTIVSEGAALAVGSGVSRGLSARELAFLCGRSVYLLAQQHLLAALDGDRFQARGRLSALVRAVALRVEPFDDVPEEDAAALGALLEALDRDAAGVHDLDRWLEALDHAADRVALLLAGDLDAAASLVGPERMDALVSFALSDAYFELRRSVGLSAV